MEFQELIKKSREISQMYDKLNESQGHSKWELEHYLQGFMEDLGSLARLVLMKSGVREPFEDLDEKLRHEVCDCLMSTIRIADALNIDLEKEFPKQMDALAKRIQEERH